MRHKKYPVLSSSTLHELARVAHDLSNTLSAWQQFLSLCQSLLEEVEAHRVAFDNHHQPITPATLLEAVTQADQELGLLLGNSRIDRAEYGRLYLKTKTTLHETTLRLHKERLAKILTKIYGTQFAVRIGQE